MEPSMFQVDEAKAKADQLAQQLDTTENAAERAGIEAELRDARDQVQALTDAQVAAGSGTSTPSRSGEQIGTQDSTQERQQVADVAEDAQLQAEVPEPAPQAPTGASTTPYSEGRQLDRANELYDQLQTGVDPTPETTAAVERWEQERGNDAGQVRDLRDGESITGTVESTVTVDGQAYNVLQVEHEDGTKERVRVPADPDHEHGDQVTASREGAEIEVHHDYGHGL
ncbi:hypothetical protein XacyCFBP2565_21970 [Xanthomonas arboricola pv. corylina]|uniref:hypothetical protein n=1 Tax=Xanthomonas arboricola TaxID=56448 RepID=UPI000D48F786|nr:hypothetical protein [Xanthomonas arboricola]PPU05232.1 hypothetical protein XacyCFBP2565_21970 [Xanthomonas arboricola pv. corylina]